MTMFISCPDHGPRISPRSPTIHQLSYVSAGRGIPSAAYNQTIDVPFGKQGRERGRAVRSHASTWDDLFGQPCERPQSGLLQRCAPNARSTSRAVTNVSSAWCAPRSCRRTAEKGDNADTSSPAPTKRQRSHTCNLRSDLSFRRAQNGQLTSRTSNEVGLNPCDDTIGKIPDKVIGRKSNLQVS